MSANIMGSVWDLELPHNEKLVLLAMADHADYEGNNVYPSLQLIAWKTDYDERQVRRIVDILEAKGILVTCKRRAGLTTLYRINLQAAPRKTPFSAVRGRPRTDAEPSRTADKTGGKPINKTPDISLSLFDKTPDISDVKPRTFSAITPDISGTHIQDAGASEEPVLIQILEKRNSEPAAGPLETGLAIKSETVRTKKSKAAGHDATGFAAFYSAYPRKVAGSKAHEVWDRLKPNADLQSCILAAVAAMQVVPDWDRDSRQFVPYPATYLNQRRWEDELMPAPAPVAPVNFRLYNPDNDIEYSQRNKK